MTLSERIRQARSEAYKEAKSSGLPWVFSRGAYVSTVDASGDQCDPWPGAEAVAWDGKLKNLPKLVEEVSRHPHVAALFIEGGYDGAENMEAKRVGNYEPWIASWQVEVWRRG